MNRQRLVPNAAEGRGNKDLAAIALQASWKIDGITVSQAEVHLWMASVGHKVPDGRYWYYVKWYDVPRKIADAKRNRTFKRIVAEACMAAGIVLDADLKDSPAPAAMAIESRPDDEPLTALIRILMPSRASGASDAHQMNGGLQ